ADTSVGGLVRQISSLPVPNDGSPYRWRARVRSRSPLFGASHWVSLAGNAATEFDFHTLWDPDGDGMNASADLCPYFAQTKLRLHTDGDGRGDECECGDQNGDGRNPVADIVAINQAIFNPALATPLCGPGVPNPCSLCDANNDGRCNVSDIVAVNVEI